MKLFTAARTPEPEKPKFPTADFAYDMAAALLEYKKLKKKKDRDKNEMNGVDLDV